MFHADTAQNAWVACPERDFIPQDAVVDAAREANVTPPSEVNGPYGDVFMRVEVQRARANLASAEQMLSDAQEHVREAECLQAVVALHAEPEVQAAALRMLGSWYHSPQELVDSAREVVK